MSGLKPSSFTETVASTNIGRILFRSVLIPVERCPAGTRETRIYTLTDSLNTASLLMIACQQTTSLVKSFLCFVQEYEEMSRDECFREQHGGG